MFISEREEVVLSGLTAARLESGDVDAFGALSAQEVVAPVAVGGADALAGPQPFRISDCTPAAKNLPTRIEKSCTGQGTIRASGGAAFGSQLPLLLVGDEGDCVGQCQIKTPAGPVTAPVLCRLKVRRSAQHDAPAARRPAPPRAAPARHAPPASQPAHPPPAEAPPAHAACYLTASDELLFLTEAEYAELCRAAAPLQKAIDALAEAKARGDAGAARAAQAEAKKHLPPIEPGPRLSRTDLAEVLDFRGGKYTYVRSDKIANHRRRYKLDVDLRDQSKLRGRDGRFDREKLKKALREVKFKVGGGSKPWDFYLFDWAEAVSKGLRVGTSQDPKADATTHFDASAEARLFRCYGRAYAYELSATSLTEWKFAASSQATLSLFEGAASATWWPASRDGIEFTPQPPGFAHPLVLGRFRPSLAGKLSGFVGVSLAASADLGVSQKEHHAGVVVSGEAFAGAKAEGRLDLALDWKESPAATWAELGKVGYGLTGAIGAGIGGEFRVGFDRKLKTFMVRWKYYAVFSAGLGGAFDFEVNSDNVLALARYVARALRAADFQPLEFLLEVGVTQILGDLLGWSAAMGRAAEEAYRLLDVVRKWWRMPWASISPDAFAARLAANPPELRLTPPEGKAKLLRLLCEVPQFANQPARELAMAQVLGWTQSRREREAVLTWLSPDGRPWSEEEGRRFLLAFGGPAIAGRLEQLEAALPPQANPAAAHFTRLA